MTAVPPARVVRPLTGSSVRHHGVETLRTPFVEVDLGAVAERARLLRSAFPVAAVVVPVGARPEPGVLRALVEAGCDLEVDGHTQAWAALAVGASVDDLVEIGGQLAAGVRIAVVDRRTPLASCARPFGVAVLARADTAASARRILRAAVGHGLHPAGVCLDVASPDDPAAWQRVGATFRQVCADARSDGRARPWWLGLRTDVVGDADDVRRQGAYLRAALTRLEVDRPRVVLHTGTSVLGAGSTLVATVVSVTGGRVRRVRLDADPGAAGRAELETSADGDAVGPCLLGGPSGIASRVAELPLGLRTGDVVRVPWFDAGRLGQPEVPVLAG